MIFLGLYRRIREYGFIEGVRSIYEKYSHKHDKFLLSPIDMMIPVNGIITAGQYVIISRLIDYELILEGRPTKWDKRLTQLEKQGEWTEATANYFRELVSSLDKYGWDFNLSSVYINRVPLYAYNGTHRLAYALKNNPYQVVPFTAFCDGWAWSREEGYKYWKNKGLGEDELKQLLNRYEILLEEIDSSLYIVLPKNQYQSIIDDDYVNVVEAQVIKISKKLDLNVSFNRELTSLLGKVNSEIVVLRCLLKKQLLSVRKHRIYSKYLDAYTKKYKSSQKYYTSTLTEANELRLLLKNYSSNSI